MSQMMRQDKVYVPPIKIQGIKTKIVPAIRENVVLSRDTLWVEPFMGSGVVGFNLLPRRAVFADINPYLIAFYNQIREGRITAARVRAFLEEEGGKLAEGDDRYYYEVRERFNSRHDPLDFLFLNRSCFNGMIRFNKENGFNVPYGHKPQRFAKAYVTKIVNQVRYVEEALQDADWRFVCQPFEKTLAATPASAFVYCDPPYIGRHVDYYDSWTETDETRLRDALLATGAKFMVSTWDFNAYRRNEYIQKVWGFCQKLDIPHFYHVGAKETNRNPMMEALLTNYQPQPLSSPLPIRPTQEQLNFPFTF